MKQYLTHCILAASAALAPALASAKVLGSGTFGGWNDIALYPGQSLLAVGRDQNGNAQQQLLVKAAKAGTYLLTYNATCFVQSSGNYTGSGVNIIVEVLVNGTAVTNQTDDYMCGGNSDSYSWGTPKHRTSLVIPVTLNAGVNTITLTGQVVGSPALAGYLGHSHITVSD
ncbi:MAG: hypothetical protein C4K60_02505 [Ideonella sp. MAG2]|nr:MAG: hypothetical protein C4K60_02505 [Ideonella sp. MAG2]